jgi:hypothetical protein
VLTLCVPAGDGRLLSQRSRHAGAIWPALEDHETAALALEEVARRQSCLAGADHCDLDVARGWLRLPVALLIVLSASRPRVSQTRSLSRQLGRRVTPFSVPNAEGREVHPVDRLIRLAPDAR